MTDHQGSPLYPLLNEINRAAASGMPFLAVAMTVALPDLCVSLASVNGRTNGELYKQWCRDNLGPEFDVLTAEDFWSMRCGVLHNGRFGDMKHSVARVIFALPSPQQNVFVNCQMNDAYFYSVVDFCRNFTQAVFIWCEKHKQDANVQANMPRLMQYRIGGLSPYVGGRYCLGLRKGLTMGQKESGELSKSEIARSRDEALRRALNTPPKPHEDMKLGKQKKQRPSAASSSSSKKA